MHVTYLDVYFRMKKYALEVSNFFHWAQGNEINM